MIVEPVCNLVLLIQILNQKRLTPGKTAALRTQTLLGLILLFVAPTVAILLVRFDLGRLLLLLLLLLLPSCRLLL
jgi:hypothetical protein